MSRAKVKASEANRSRPELSPPGAGGTCWVVWVLSALLALAVFLDLLFYTGFYASDDLQYLQGARELAEHGRLTFITSGTIRFMLLLPLAAVIKLTHHNLFLMVAFFISFHLLVTVATYWVGRLVHGPATGLLAAGVLAVCPLAVNNASMVLPDHAVTGLVLLSLGTFLVAGDRLKQTPAGSRGAYVLLALSGLLLGLSWGAKITSVIMLPVLGAVLVSWAPRTGVRTAARAAAWLLLGLVVAAGLLWGMFYLATGLYLPHQDANFANLADTVAERIAAKGYDTPALRLARLYSFVNTDRYLGVFRWLFALGLIVYPFLRRRSWAIYVTFFWLVPYMTWGTFSFRHYLAPPVHIRYFLLALPFAAIPLAYVTARASGRLWSWASRWTAAKVVALGAAAFLALLLLMNCSTAANREAGNLHWSPEVAALRYALDYAAQSDSRPVVLSYWLSARMKPLFRDARYQRVILTKAAADLSQVQRFLEDDGFLYLDCAYEHYPKHRSPTRVSPLDATVGWAVRGAESVVAARTLGTFAQFKSRLSALRYVLGGSGHDMELRRDTRAVFVREVTRSNLRARPLTEGEAQVLDLAPPGVFAPTWVYNLRDCRVQRDAQGSAHCEVVGSDVTSSGQYGGVRFTTGPVEAIRLDVTFGNPEAIAAVFLDLTSGIATAKRLRWQLVPAKTTPLPTGEQSYTFRENRPAGAFVYVGGGLSLEECDHAHLFVRLKGTNSRAAFRVHRVLVQRPPR